MSINSLRNRAYPFDWVRTDLNGLINCIDNKFENFLDEKLLMPSDKFAPWHIMNTKYKIEFCHDFTTSGYYIDNDNVHEVQKKMIRDQIEAIKQKYNRRINRFYNASSLFEKIFFIRHPGDNRLNDYFEYKDYFRLMNALKTLFPYNNWKLIILTSNKTVINYKIPNCIFIKLEKFDDNKRWANIFDDLKVLKI